MGAEMEWHDRQIHDAQVLGPVDDQVRVHYAVLLTRQHGTAADGIYASS